MRDLLATGIADPWAKDSSGKTPIQLAKDHRHTRIAEELYRADEFASRPFDDDHLPSYEESENQQLLGERVSDGNSMTKEDLSEKPSPRESTDRGELEEQHSRVIKWKKAMFKQ